jgi:hypothetical protein
LSFSSSILEFALPSFDWLHAFSPFWVISKKCLFGDWIFHRCKGNHHDEKSKGNIRGSSVCFGSNYSSSQRRTELQSCSLWKQVHALRGLGYISGLESPGVSTEFGTRNYARFCLQHAFSKNEMRFLSGQGKSGKSRQRETEGSQAGVNGSKRITV